MGYAEKLYEKAKNLPENLVVEIFDFANFLEMRQARGEEPITSAPNWGAETLRLAQSAQHSFPKLEQHDLDREVAAMRDEWERPL